MVLGAGHFGQRAVKVLGLGGQRALWVVDRDMDSLSKLRGSNIELIHDDAVDYLIRNKGGLPEGTEIVPAVPFHFAWEFAKRVLKERGYQVEPIPIPPEVKYSLPHVWEAADGSLLISYADFRCPDDCPEPPYCTVTGEKRKNPLYKLLSDLDVKGFRLYIVRSHQMAAGVGGYTLGDLLRLRSVLEAGGPAKWLLGTACKCHGVLSGLEVKER